MPTTTTTPAPNFADLLSRATTEPGTVSAAYFTFHNYSIGNQLLAMFQCAARGIEPGPLATYAHWRALGRQVRKGEKAIELCQPVTCKRRPADDSDDHADTFTRFIYRRNWFVLNQTDGNDYQAPTPPAWDKTRALAALDVTEQPFATMDGNVQGYANARTIAVSPIAANPFKTAFHEIAHVLLGHTSEAELSDDERTPRNLRELEAESVAMLCCAALELPGIEDARGYIQSWYGAGCAIPEDSARKIFKTADAILRAGREDPHAHERPDCVHDLDTTDRAA